MSHLLSPTLDVFCTYRKGLKAVGTIEALSVGTYPHVQVRQGKLQKQIYKQAQECL